MGIGATLWRKRRIPRRVHGISAILSFIALACLRWIPVCGYDWSLFDMLLDIGAWALRAIDDASLWVVAVGEIVSILFLSVFYGVAAMVCGWIVACCATLFITIIREPPEEG